MNAELPLLYTNEVFPEFLRTLDKAPFTEQELADFNEQALATVNKNQAYVFSNASRYT
ncbi:hypothetical protein C4K04_2727 [Pseudomonas chlororaphis]|uniref:Uncharacterized protein n=1 Tax=Pseudomonas chlororaphis TaxID=587753 RepID=A0A3G7TQ52_9PSED|nr:hypothetical protein [Pseudomonas chlororaphis]AZE48399.1 hypothetical protein C4K04_2727 [Pseudomonas chlororaphis]